MKGALSSCVMRQYDDVPKVKDPFRLVKRLLWHLRGKKSSV